MIDHDCGLAGCCDVKVRMFHHGLSPSVAADLADLLDRLVYFTDEGPWDEGWKSTELKALIGRLEAVVDDGSGDAGAPGASQDGSGKP